MKNIFLYFTVFFLSISCSGKKGDFQPIIQHAQELLPNHPDSAYNFLEIHKHAIHSKQDKAVLSLLKYYVQDLTVYDFYDDTGLIQLMQSNHHYTDNFHKTLAAYYKGVFLISKAEYENAFELFHTAEQGAIALKNNHLLGMIYDESAKVFNELSFFKTSIEYADKSYHHFLLAGDTKYANRSLRNKIHSLLELKETEVSEKYYEIVKQEALLLGDKEFLTDLCAEQLSILLYYKDIVRAENVYKDLLEIKTGDEPSPIQYLYLGKKYITQNKPDSALLCLIKADEKTVQTYDRILLQSLYSDYYRNIEDFKNALYFLDQTRTLEDSIITLNQRTSLVKIESRSQSLLTSLKYEREMAEQKRIIYWGTFAMCILLFFILLYRNKIKKQKDELDSRLAIVSELKNSNQNLVGKLNTHKEKENKLKEEIENKLKYAKMFADLYYKYPNKPGTILKKMDEMIDLVPTNKEFTSGIIHNVNLYYNNAIKKLVHTHKTLTESETLFSALIISGFSAQEMSLILNCNSVDAVYTRKYRLKQKLSVDKNTDIEDYLNTLTKE